MGAPGELRRAIPWLNRSLEACRREGFYFLSNVAAFTGGVYARAGRIADGIALLEGSGEQSAAMGYMANRSRRLTTLADAYLTAERLEEALETIRQTIEVDRACKNRALEAEALHILGEIQARQDPPDVASAESSYRQVLALATEIGLRPLAARCHLGLGRLYRAASNRSAAEAHLTTARTMLAEMNMGFWLDQAEAELGQLAR